MKYVGSASLALSAGLSLALISCDDKPNPAENIKKVETDFCTTDPRHSLASPAYQQTVYPFGESMIVKLSNNLMPTKIWCEIEVKRTIDERISVYCPGLTTECGEFNDVPRWIRVVPELNETWFVWDNKSKTKERRFILWFDGCPHNNRDCRTSTGGGGGYSASTKDDDGK